jgi:hypothetical protein
MKIRVDYRMSACWCESGVSQTDRSARFDGTGPLLDIDGCARDRMPAQPPTLRAGRHGQMRVGNNETTSNG